VNVNSAYEYEIFTQVYGKFLYILSRIALKKENYLKCMGYVSIGINIMKVFFIRKKVATEIKTYKIYAQLILALINMLIGDNNYKQALIYCKLLFNIFEVSQKFFHYKQNEGNVYKRIFSPQTIKKFFKFAAYAFIYAGCCFEQFDLDHKAYDAYKQAHYFFGKSTFVGNIFKDVNSINIFNSCNYLAMTSIDNLNIKFERERIELRERSKKLEKLRRLEKFQELQREKQMKLKFISNGYIGTPFKYNKLEEKLEKELFPSHIKKDLDKIDDDLLAFVFTYYHINKELSETNKDKLSNNTKNYLSRYELYNILMSKSFREFIINSKKLYFNNPKTGIESVSEIRRYINKRTNLKAEMKAKKKLNVKNQLNDIQNKQKTFSSTNYEGNVCKTNSSNYQTNRITNLEADENSKSEKRYGRNKYSDLKFKRYLTTETKDISNTYRNRVNTGISDSNYVMRKSVKGINTYDWDRNCNILYSDFERKNLDKNLMTKRYFNKFTFYNELSNNELRFQKLILACKNNNTLYNPKKRYENDDMNIITMDEIKRKFFIINEKINQNNTNNNGKKDEIKDIFSSGDTYFGKKMKFAMSKVINKYISQSRTKKQIKKGPTLDEERLKKINGKSLYSINSSLKDINKRIQQLKMQENNLRNQF
jgi:hypothetical protein